LKALEEQYKNAQLLFGVGRIARVDLLKVEVQLANERQRLISIETGIATAMATLRTLMGEPDTGPGEAPILADTLTLPEMHGDFFTGVETAHRQRPEYLSASQGVEEAGINRKLAFGKLLPTVSAFAGYLDQFAFNPGYKEANWYTGLNLSLPLFDRSLYADLSRQRIETERAKERLKAIDNQLRLDIRTALNSLDESKARIAAAEQAVAQAEEAYRIEQQRFQTGAGAVVDLLLAQSADISAAANYSQALYDTNAAVVAYRKATGTLEEYLK
jgi:outer membrane protein TolC